MLATKTDYLNDPYMKIALKIWPPVHEYPNPIHPFVVFLVNHISLQEVFLTL